MNKYQTYFGQIITDDELNEIFDSFATAIEQFVQDFNYSGIAVGGEVVQNASPNMTVLVSGPTVIYDQQANRISFAAPVPVNCALDENNQPTAVTNTGNEKYLSVFAKFVRTPTDPREDDLGNTVFFRQVASYQFKVVQGSEAPVGTAPRPPLRGDQILIADVRIVANQTSILTADVSSTRSQVIFDLAGTPLAVRQKSLRPVLQAMVDAINGVNTDTLIVPAIPGSPTALPTSSVHAMFAAFLAAFNIVANQLAALVGQVGGMPQNLSGVAFLAANQTFTGTNAFGQLSASGNASFTGPVNASGNVSAASVSVSGSVTVGNDIVVSDDITCDDCTVGGDLNVGGDIALVHNLTVGGNLSITTKLVTQDLEVNGLLTSSDGTLNMPNTHIEAFNIKGTSFLYSSAQARVTELQTMLGQPGINTVFWAPCWYLTQGVWEALWWATDSGTLPGDTAPGPGLSCVLDIPLHLPHGSVLNRVEILHYMPTTHQNDFRIYKLKSAWGTDSAPPGFPVTDNPADDWWGSDSLPTTPGWHTTVMEGSLFGGSGLTISTNNQYFLRCFAGKTGGMSPLTGTPACAIVARVRMFWTDLGPRNY